MNPPAWGPPAQPLSSGNGATVTGVVQAAQANYYRVQVQIPAPQENDAVSPTPLDLLCTRRSRLKKLGQQIVVGDRVQVSLAGGFPATQETGHPLEQGVIEAVFPRHSFFPRPPIANVDQALVVFSLAEPPLDPLHLSRFLVQAEASGVEVQLCLNKIDLLTEAEQQRWSEQIRHWGYTPLWLSAKTGLGLQQARQICRGKISILMGLSGVGKSSLLNVLTPGLALATQPVSGRLRHGRHTTRHVELFPLTDPEELTHSSTCADHGWIADSPGFNQISLTHCEAATLDQQFPEIRHLLGQCQFRDCLHQEEPGCQIRAYGWERYPFYLLFLQEIQQRGWTDLKASDSSSARPESTDQAIQLHPSKSALPQLSSQLRHPSRRRQRQQTQTWRGNLAALLEIGAIDEV